MRIVVSYATQIRWAVGCYAEQIDIDEASSVQDLLVQLVGRHGDRLQQLIFDDDGRLLPSIMVCVNNQQVVDGQQSLAEGDEILLMSAISGG